MAGPFRYKLTVAYEGTNFHGWQKQEPPEGAQSGGVVLGPHADETRVKLRTVQEVLEQAVRAVVREEVLVTGASRTDAGVHAGAHVAWMPGGVGGQVAAFTSAPDPDRGVGWPADRGTDRLIKAINGKLPGDVVVLRAEAVPSEFDPISDAIEKAYSYTIADTPTGRTSGDAPAFPRPLWDRRLVTQTWHRLDAGAMNAAAQAFVGEHDFAAFAKAGHGRKTTVRTVTACSVTRTPSDHTANRDGRVRIDIAGTGFLHNMVRIIAGTLLEVGRGAMTTEDVRTAIDSRDRALAGPTLGPEGLRLEWIRYPGDPSPVSAGEDSPA